MLFYAFYVILMYLEGSGMTWNEMEWNGLELDGMKPL